MNTERAAQPHFAIAIVLFALAFLVPSWPWLSGAVTVPYDAKSSVLPPIEFMAHAFATGASPFWSPNIFAGWPNIADPHRCSPAAPPARLASEPPGSARSTASRSRISSSALLGSSFFPTAGGTRGWADAAPRSRSAGRQRAASTHREVISLAYFPPRSGCWRARSIARRALGAPVRRLPARPQFRSRPWKSTCSPDSSSRTGEGGQTARAGVLALIAAASRAYSSSRCRSG